MSTLPNVRISQRPRTSPPLMAAPSKASTSAAPLVWLGAKSPGGLALPCATPTPSQMYAPRGVWLDSERLIVCDSGNHRILIWNGLLREDGQPADVVLGQRDFFSEGPACGNGDHENGLHLPTGVIVTNGKLLICDAWHHRVLVWNQVPTHSQRQPDYAIGQDGLTHVEPNGGHIATAGGLYWPYGIAYIANRLYIADTGNRRILSWHGIPEANQPAERVLGQSDFFSTGENRDGPVAGNSFRWPHALAGYADQLWIADAGNHRILGWTNQPMQGRPADYVIGQETMSVAREWPYDVQGERRLRFPYGMSIQDNCLAVADTANNRILFWQLPILQPAFAPARDVIGQIDFAKFGENHWQAVTHQSICWPYGISLHDGRLAIADSGNNRVMIWDCSEIVSACNNNLKPMNDQSSKCV